MNINEILINARQRGCSDVHITQGLPVALRLHGSLVKEPYQMSQEETEEIILSLCTQKQREKVKYGEDLDFAYDTSDGGRYRINIYHHKKGLSAAIRILRGDIPSLEELKLPQVIGNLCDEPNGLILVTGPTGSGKSTTLAAIIDYISRKRGGHILTVEDPIEYVFDQNNALVHQREVGENVGSFAMALRSALREDPDVILVGEMRDFETISTAVTAAETGHLVLSTLHTVGASNTIDRIVDTCPPESQQQMRSQLSMILRGVITQQLIPTITGDGRIVATEVLIGVDAVSNLIRENKCHQLATVMQSGMAQGMHTMNSNLAELVRNGYITEEKALASSTDKKDLKQYLI